MSLVFPFQVQTLIDAVVDVNGRNSHVEIRCAQALGSEIYVGCSNGELLRFSLQMDDRNKPPSYSLLSRQVVGESKAIGEIVLIPCVSRALVLSENQIYFYTTPSLDVVPAIKPIRHVQAFAVDDTHLRRPPQKGNQMMAVDFTVVKRNTLAMYSLRDRLIFHKEIPFSGGSNIARRIGHTLCVASKGNYVFVDLESATALELLPVSQVDGPTPIPIKPAIIPISNAAEFLILSWTGVSTIGVFLTIGGDPTRGTLEWSSHPDSVCLDYPYVLSFMPDRNIEVRSIETQTIVQVLPAPTPPSPSPTRSVFNFPVTLAHAMGSYLVPSLDEATKLKKIPVRLLRSPQISV